MKLINRIVKNKIVAKSASVALALFSSVVPSLDKKLKEATKNLQYNGIKVTFSVKSDMIFCYLHYNINPNEYFRFGFINLSDKGRKAYISDSEVLKICDAISDKETGRLFRDKFKAYEVFGKYYKRKIIKTSDASEDDLESFIDSTTDFIVKPIDQSKGKGIKTFSVNEDSVSNIITEIKSIGDSIIEEIIIEKGFLRDVHPKSVNTIRFATYLDKNNKVEYMYSLIRIGCGDSTVDNISAGGIFAGVDINNGIINTPAYDLLGNTYVVHPDTRIPIIGQQLPEWDLLRSLADEVAHLVPKQKYVGWDFAYSTKGWVIVEANHRPGVQGIQTLGGGIRKLIEKTISKSLK